MLLFKEQIEAALDLCGYRAGREKDTWQCPVDGHNNDDNRPSLFVGEDSSGFAIIRCRSQGHTSRDVIMALRRQLGHDHPVFVTIPDAEPVPVAQPEPEEDNHELEDEVARRLEARAGSEAYHKALADRHLTGESLARLGVGVCHEDPDQPITASYPLTRLSVPITNAEGTILGTIGIDPSKTHTGLKVRGTKGTPRQLYPAPEFYEGGSVLLVEGEMDAISAVELGFQAIACPGAESWKPEWAERFRRFDRVSIIFDCDAAGRNGAKKAVESLLLVVADTRIIDLDPDRNDGYDINDFLIEQAPVQDGREEALAQAFEAISDLITQATAKTRLATLSFSDVAMEKVEFLRPGVPLGKMTVIAGDPGLGKSTLAALWAAEASRGVGSFKTPISALLITGEDGAADTIKPRLEAAQADVSMVYAIDLDTHVSFPDSVLDLEQTITALGVKLVVIDPLNSFMSTRVDTNRDASVRTTLTPLAKMAERTGAAIVIVAHLTKDTKNRNPLYRINGSIGTVGAARSVFLFARDPNDEDGNDRILAHVKHNLGPLEYNKRLRIESAELGLHNPVPYLVDIGVSPVSTRELLATSNDT